MSGKRTTLLKKKFIKIHKDKLNECLDKNNKFVDDGKYYWKQFKRGNI